MYSKASHFAYADIDEVIVVSLVSAYSWLFLV